MFRLVRCAVLLSLFILLTGAVTAQDKDKEKAPKEMAETPWYPLAVGTTWTYKNKDGSTFVMKVTRHEDVKDVRCARVTLLIDGKEQGHEHVAVTSDGIKRLSFGGVTPDKPILILKLPPRSGDSWAIDAKAGNEVLKGNFKVSEEEVKVPAGTYKAYCVGTDDLDAGGIKVVSKSCYASGVGMVQQEITIGANKNLIQLEKFEAGKK